MADLEQELDGLVDELGATKVRKLSKSFVSQLDPQHSGTVDPVLRSLVSQYGAEEVESAFRKMGESLSGVDNARTVRREDIKVGRNEPCTCGSGKKFKKCCG
ncbi:MAG: hypothetical protein ACI9OJ_000485 [Myxococcota bacterium]|jgi:uncharacterized protein YchJ